MSEDIGRSTETKELQGDLVRELRRVGVLRNSCVDRAFSLVPRHKFVPEVSIETAYTNIAIPIKRANGELVSSSSQPSLMAFMLEQSHLSTSMNVLEIGTGSGYNAALISAIVGDGGYVTTIDIDEDIVERARDTFDFLEIGNIKVICGDGALGHARDLLYDRIIVTAAAPDVPPAWWDQLRDGGLLIIPLSVQGAKKLVTFRKTGDKMISLNISDCGFVAMRGVYEDDENFIRCPELPGVRIAARNNRISIHNMYTILSQKPQRRLTSCRSTGDDLLGGFALWLAVREGQNFLKLSVEGTAVQLNTFPAVSRDPSHRLDFTFGLIVGDGVALLELDAFEDTRPTDIIICSYGNAEEASRRLAEQLIQWHAIGHPRSRALSITAFRASQKDFSEATRALVRLRYSTLEVAWNSR